jgi:hypothetical protein
MASRNGEAWRGSRPIQASKSVSSPADLFEIAPTPLEIQTSRLLARYSVSPSLAAVIASHAYGVADRWGRA